MNPNEAQSLIEAVMTALQLDTAGRKSFLESLRARSPELGAEVARLVARHERGTGEIVAPDEGLPGAAGRTAVDRASEGPGTRIGVYKLLQQIGEGGFGTVYMAEQESPVRRRVALKIIKLGMDTRRVIARFEAERQALAVMDHANIAKVLDAGATETGRPYFVMELVTGEPITRYCDTNHLTIAERLALFEQVCAAVQHAHQKGIIHRDIKPSNVLVSTQDGRPFTKVIDFGIAKATGARLTEKTLFTEHRALIGTPEYMSPEQAQGSLDVDTRTDVYSLGVLLYELLTGSTPFGAEQLRGAAYAEIERIIREVEPLKPSTRLSQSAEALPGIAALRRVEPRRLGSIVRGELDWIVMKALEKDRARRYETASGLGADVRRCLAGEAVVAAPASRVYQVKKFVRLHRAGVSTGVMVGAALVMGLGVALWQANVAAGERDAAKTAGQEQKRLAGIADQRAEEATREAARSTAVTAFLKSMLEANKPEEAQGKELTVAEVLERATGRINAELVSEPTVRAELLSIIGNTYCSLGRTEKAGPVLREALALAEQLYGKKSVLRADILEGLTSVIAAESSGEGESATESLWREIYEIRRELLGEGHPRTLDAMGPVVRLEHFKDAEPQQKAFVAMLAIASAGKWSPAQINEDLEMSVRACEELWAQGRHEEAKRMSRRFTERYALTEGARDRAATAAVMMAESLSTRGFPGAVRAIAYAAIELETERSGPSHTNTFGVLAVGERALMKVGAFDEAAEVGRRAIAAGEASLKPDNRLLFVTIGNTGESLMRAGRFAEAEVLYRKLSEATPALKGRMLAIAQGRHGTCLLKLGRLDEAAVQAEAAYATAGKAQAPTELMRSAVQLLIDVSEARGDAEGKAKWSAKLADLPAEPASKP